MTKTEDKFVTTSGLKRFAEKIHEDSNPHNLKPEDIGAATKEDIDNTVNEALKKYTTIHIPTSYNTLMRFRDDMTPDELVALRELGEDKLLSELPDNTWKNYEGCIIGGDFTGVQITRPYCRMKSGTVTLNETLKLDYDSHTTRIDNLKQAFTVPSIPDCVFSSWQIGNGGTELSYVSDEYIPNTNYHTKQVYANGVWLDDSYRTITYGTNSTDEFYVERSMKAFFVDNGGEDIVLPDEPIMHLKDKDLVNHYIYVPGQYGCITNYIEHKPVHERHDFGQSGWYHASDYDITTDTTYAPCDPPSIVIADTDEIQVPKLSDLDVLFNNPIKTAPSHEEFRDAMANVALKDGAEVTNFTVKDGDLKVEASTLSETEVKGRYQFNENITLADLGTTTVNHTATYESNGTTETTLFTTTRISSTGIYSLGEYNEELGMEDNLHIYNTEYNYWGALDRMVDFGSEPQTVPAELKSWLNANGQWLDAEPTHAQVTVGDTKYADGKIVTSQSVTPSDGTVVGKYRFNRNFNPNGLELGVDVNFTSNGLEFNRMLITDLDWEILYFLNLDQDNWTFDNRQHLYDNLDQIWYPEYEIVDFGQTPQTVPAEFREFLDNESNGTWLPSEIEINLTDIALKSDLSVKYTNTITLSWDSPLPHYIGDGVNTKNVQIEKPNLEDLEGLVRVNLTYKPSPNTTREHSFDMFMTQTGKSASGAYGVAAIQGVICEISVYIPRVGSISATIISCGGSDSIGKQAADSRYLQITDAADTYAKQNGAQVSNFTVADGKLIVANGRSTNSVKGRYRFNETISFVDDSPTSDPVSVNFSCNGTAYDRIAIYSDLEGMIIYYCIGDDVVEVAEGMSEELVSRDYALIDFGETSQTVPVGLKTWLDANGTWLDIKSLIQLGNTAITEEQLVALLALLNP